MKADLFKALKAISLGDFDYFQSLPEDELKQLSPYVLMLWLKNPESERGIRTIMLNEHVNSYVFSFGSSHNQLLYKLFCYSQGSSNPCRYQFRKTSTDKKLSLIMEYMNINKDKAKTVLPRLSSDALMDMARELDWSEKQLKELK